MPENIKLSPNFTLNEFLVTEHISLKTFPSMEIIDNLKFLTNLVMEPLRKIINAPIIITSGYRNEEINKAVHGSFHSLHLTGLACDFHIGKVGAKHDLEFFFKGIRETSFDKLIYYADEERFHVEHNRSLGHKRAYIKGYSTFELITPRVHE